MKHIMSFEESILYFDQKFRNLITDINSPISDKLLSLNGKDLDDLVLNYLTYEVNNNSLDLVFGKLDNKVSSELYFLDSSLDTFIEFEDLPNHRFSVAHNNLVKVFRELTPKEKEDNDLGNDAIYIVTRKYNNQDYYSIAYGHSLKRENGDVVKYQGTKIGRFVTNLLTTNGIEFTQPELEKFINIYKSKISAMVEGFTQINTAKGKDILRIIHGSGYAKTSGTLGSSCMRYDQCQNFFQLFVDNPDKLELIYLLDDKKKVIARAFLWNLGDTKYLDRVYATDDSKIFYFHDYAILNGWLYRKGYGVATEIMKNAQPFDGNIKLTVPYKEYDRMPYMDTFKNMYVTEDDITLSFEPIDIPNSKHFVLKQSNGLIVKCSLCGTLNSELLCDECEGTGCDECNYAGFVECPKCGVENYTVT